MICLYNMWIFFSVALLWLKILICRWSGVQLGEGAGGSSPALFPSFFKIYPVCPDFQRSSLFLLHIPCPQKILVACMVMSCSDLRKIIKFIRCLGLCKKIGQYWTGMFLDLINCRYCISVPNYHYRMINLRTCLGVGYEKKTGNNSTSKAFRLGDMKNAPFCPNECKMTSQYWSDFQII